MLRNCLQLIIHPRCFNIRFGSAMAATAEISEPEQRMLPLPETESQWEEFEKNFRTSRENSTYQKNEPSTDVPFTSFGGSKRNIMFNWLGDAASEQALKNCCRVLNSYDEGKRIIEGRPLINTKTVNILKLRMLPKSTLGRKYVQFLDDNNVTPDSGPTVQFIESPAMAYILTRYRECHSLVHTVLGLPTNNIGRAAVKWIEALNYGLPMCYAAAAFAVMKLQPKERKKYLTQYLPWAVINGKNITPLITIYWEERWEQDIEDLRIELGITALKRTES